MQDGIISFLFFLFEFALTIYIITRYDQFYAKWSIVGLLSLLQMYQLTEFLICAGLGTTLLPRIGFVIITFLPPLGHYLTNRLTKSKSRDYLVSFGLGLYFGFYYMLSSGSVVLLDCNPFYAVYRNDLGNEYGLFYFGVILYSMIKLLHFNNYKFSMYNTPSKFLLGYLLFLVPMIITGLLDEHYLNAVPSILCKYAILLAVMLGGMARSLYYHPLSTEEIPGSNKYQLGRQQQRHA